MKRFRGYWSLIIIVLVAALALTYTFAAGNKPLLGLDLQGGVSVVLQPKGETDSDTINEAIAIIRQRVDALGVAEPEITRQGDNILIQIPGVKDKDRAIALVGQTAELQFRPVLAALDPSVVTDPATTTTVDPAATTTVAPVEGDTGDHHDHDRGRGQPHRARARRVHHRPHRRAGQRRRHRLPPAVREGRARRRLPGRPEAPHRRRPRHRPGHPRRGRPASGS